MMGIDASQSRPFDVLFQNSPTNPFPYDSTLFIFTRQSVVWLYGNGKISCIGKWNDIL